MLDFCIITTTSYIESARELIKSIKRFHKDSVIHLLIPDAAGERISSSTHSENLRVYSLSEVIGQGVFLRFAFQYTPFELCCALKPHLIERALENSSSDFLVYLDSDMEVFGELDYLFDNSADIFLTPHPISTQITRNHHYDYRNIRMAGIFNAGFVGLKRLGPESGLFLDWWSKRLEFDCINGPTNSEQEGLFVDQKWLDLVPSIFSNTRIVQSKAVNTGHWTISQGEITFDEDRMLVEGEPLRLFHYSGYYKESGAISPDKVLCRYATRDLHMTHLSVDVYERYMRFIENYLNRLNEVRDDLDDGLTKIQTIDLLKYNDGAEIDPSDRRLFLSLWKVFEDKITVNPFGIPNYFRAMQEYKEKDRFEEFATIENQYFILQLLQESSRKVIIWGLNNRGRRCTEVLEACGVTVQAYIDRSASKLKVLEQKPVYEPEDLRTLSNEASNTIILVNATDPTEQISALTSHGFYFDVV